MLYRSIMATPVSTSDNIHVDAPTWKNVCNKSGNISFDPQDAKCKCETKFSITNRSNFRQLRDAVRKSVRLV